MIGLDGVSRETRDALQRYAGLLLKWNASINLIGRATEDAIWNRHIVDALQLSKRVDGVQRWADFGSGAGLPGIPLALALRDLTPEPDVLLIESDRRKALFLREAVRTTGAPARVVHDRIENVAVETGRMVTARALAPLDILLGYAEPWIGSTGRAVFLKGRSAQLELTQARRSWTFHVKQTPSESDPDGVILEISEVRRKDVENA